MCFSITIYLPAGRSLNLYEPLASVDVSFFITLVFFPVPTIPISRMVTSCMPASPESFSPFPLVSFSIDPEMLPLAVTSGGIGIGVGVGSGVIVGAGSGVAVGVGSGVAVGVGSGVAVGVGSGVAVGVGSGVAVGVGSGVAVGVGVGGA